VLEVLQIVMEKHKFLTYRQH